MPDELDSPGTGRRLDGAARPRPGRRRSMEDQGGISVSDVVAKTTGVRPVPPREQQDRSDQPGRRVHGAEPAAPARSSQPRAARPAQGPAEDPVPTDATRQPRAPRPRQPRRTTAAAPQPEAPLQRRPPAANPGPQQTSAAQQPPRRLRRPAPEAPQADGTPPRRAPRPDAAAPQRPTPDSPAPRRTTAEGAAPQRATGEGPAGRRIAGPADAAAQQRPGPASPASRRPADAAAPPRATPDSPAPRRTAADGITPQRATAEGPAGRRPAADGPAAPQRAAADSDGVRRAAAEAGSAPQRSSAVPSRAELDPLTMTDEMEAIDEATQYRRKIDHTLARFSAAHDEMEAEEAKRRERRERLSPTSLLESTRTALHRVVTTAPEEAQADAEQTRLQEKKQRKLDRSARFGRIAAAVVAGLVFLGIGGAWGAQTYFDAKFTQVSALDENSADIQDADAQANDENFLMVGSDTRDGASAEEGVGTADSTPGARSDTVMVAHIPADRKRVVVTSFPRDLEINRPDCQKWDPAQNKTTADVYKGAKFAKLNTAYAVGGPACVTKVIQQITGLRINHFVGIDFNGFKEMVDAVHGVTINNEIPIDDSILGKVLLQTGEVTISGDQALNFVRARHVKGDPTSDYGRIKRQQEFIGALLKKVMSSDVVLDPGKLTDFINAFAKATFGDNLGVKQMMTLAQSMKGLDQSKITFLTVPTVGMANTRGNEVLVVSKTKALFDSLRNNTPLPDPKAPVPVSEQAPPTSTSKPKSSGSSKTTSTRKSTTTG
ncbi:LCP family protein [Amycolatopsis sp. NPDC024027]|uniref:LCP family protein n=1 Tax=Amycolatopsis sp. NPDC024027 TaxID=3154327 RepID=UPI0034002FB4